MGGRTTARVSVRANLADFAIQLFPFFYPVAGTFILPLPDPHGCSEVLPPCPNTVGGNTTWSWLEAFSPGLTWAAVALGAVPWLPTSPRAVASGLVQENLSW